MVIKTSTNGTIVASMDPCCGSPMSFCLMSNGFSNSGQERRRSFSADRIRSQCNLSVRMRWQFWLAASPLKAINVTSDGEPFTIRAPMSIPFFFKASSGDIGATFTISNSATPPSLASKMDCGGVLDGSPSHRAKTSPSPSLSTPILYTKEEAAPVETDESKNRFSAMLSNG